MGQPFGRKSTADEVLAGVNLTDKRFLVTGVRACALVPDDAKALWAKSEEMVGERF